MQSRLLLQQRFKCRNKSPDFLWNPGTLLFKRNIIFPLPAAPAGH